MSGEKDGGLTVAGCPITIVKGGTTTSRYDAEQSRRKLDADRRRAHTDRMYATRDHAIKQGDAARIGALRMVNEESPRLVLNYLNRDKTIRQQALSEITLLPVAKKKNEWETTFTMVCPRCVERGVAQGEAQMHVRDSHRKFTLDERRKGEVVVVSFQYDDGTKFQQAVLIAGTVSVHDTVRCDNYNCDFACRIDDSNVIEV